MGKIEVTAQDLLDLYQQRKMPHEFMPEGTGVKEKCGCGQAWDNHNPDKCEPKSLDLNDTIHDFLLEHFGAEIDNDTLRENLAQHISESVRTWLNNLIDRCLVENDSDTHIIVKDLREKI